MGLLLKAPRYRSGSRLIFIFVKHISKPITFLLNELAGSIQSHFVACVLLHLSFIETNFQPCVLLKKNLLYKSSQDF